MCSVCKNPKHSQKFLNAQFIRLTFYDTRILGRQATPYSSRLRFQNQDTHTNIQIDIQKDRPGF